MKRSRTLSVLLAIVMMCLLSPSPASAEQTYWQGSTLADWGGSGNWTNGVPNGVNADAYNTTAQTILFSSGDNYTVDSFISSNFNANFKITGGALTAGQTGVTAFQVNGLAYFDGSSGTLSGFVVSGSSYELANDNTGTLTNITLQGNGTLTGTSFLANPGTTTYLNGALTLNQSADAQINGGGGATTYLTLASSTTLKGGGGQVYLNVAAGGGTTFVQGNGFTLTNDDSIYGNGIIGNGSLALVNNGTIQANTSAPGGLVLNGTGGITNNGSLSADSGGILTLNGVIVNNSGGNITATSSGDTVQLTGGAVIQGGTLNNTAGGFLGTEAAGSATLDGLTHGTLILNGTYTGALGSTTSIQGTVQNNGNVQLNGGSGSTTYLGLIGNTTLNGAGTVTLSTATGGGSAIIQGNGYTLTNSNNNNIQGNGIIGNGSLALVNNGTINANFSGGTLTLNGGVITNNGTFEASNGGSLGIQGTIQNNGSIQVIGGSSNSYLNLIGNTTLNGPGTVTLSTASGGSPIIQGNGFTLTNSSTSTIQGGGGVIGNGSLTLINDGTINANNTTISGGQLVLNGSGGITNSGTLEASSGGKLVINNVAVNNANGNITANSSGDTVQIIFGATIRGGTLNNLHGGLLTTGVDDILDGSTDGTLTLNGTYTGNPGSTTGIQGNIQNNGNFQINGTSAGSAYLDLTGNTTMNGTGTVTLSSTGTGNAVVEGSGFTLTNNDTIQGSGAIGNGSLALINNGTIDANVSGGTLTLNGTGGITNNGTMEATNGGILAFANNFSNVGTLVVNSGSTVQVGALGSGTYTQTAGVTTVNGILDPATINLSGGQLNGTGTVSGNVVATAGTIQPGSSGATGTLTINGNLTDTGSILDIRLGGAGAGQFDVLNVDGNVNLGAGSVLDTSLINGFTPTNGETFMFLDFSGNLTSQGSPNFFGTDMLPIVEGGEFSVVEENGDSLELQFNAAENPISTPEPGTLALLTSGAIAAVGVTARRKRNRNRVDGGCKL